mmetsp:Transcript_2340/g.9030  ORF Transcript_2340/g.9030 Transcript_2340/m.9030 type:complete len:559 (+) Transcript_2340:250-1926(+)
MPGEPSRTLDRRAGVVERRDGASNRRAARVAIDGDGRLAPRRARVRARVRARRLRAFLLRRTIRRGCPRRAAAGSSRAGREVSRRERRARDARAGRPRRGCAARRGRRRQVRPSLLGDARGSRAPRRGVRVPRRRVRCPPRRAGRGARRPTRPKPTRRSVHRVPRRAHPRRVRSPPRRRDAPRDRRRGPHRMATTNQPRRRGCVRVARRPELLGRSRDGPSRRVRRPGLAASRGGRGDGAFGRRRDRTRDVRIVDRRSAGVAGERVGGETLCSRTLEPGERPEPTGEALRVRLARRGALRAGARRRAPARNRTRDVRNAVASRNRRDRTGASLRDRLCDRDGANRARRRRGALFTGDGDGGDGGRVRGREGILEGELEGGGRALAAPRGRVRAVRRGGSETGRRKLVQPGPEGRAFDPHSGRGRTLFRRGLAPRGVQRPRRARHVRQGPRRSMDARRAGGLPSRHRRRRRLASHRYKRPVGPRGDRRRRGRVRGGRARSVARFGRGIEPATFGFRFGRLNFEHVRVAARRGEGGGVFQPSRGKSGRDSALVRRPRHFD